MSNIQNKFESCKSFFIFIENIFTMAQSPKKRVEFKKKPANKKNQLKFAKRMQENHKVLSKLSN